MKKIAIITLFACLILEASSQCDTALIDPLNYSLIKESSKTGNNDGSLVFDGDNNSRWRTSGNGPHEIWIDLGSVNNVTGMAVRTRWQKDGRVSSYQVFVTNDTATWSLGERFDVFHYASNPNEDTAYFGGVSGRYVKLIAESEKGDLQLSELRFFRDTCANNGKTNQPINFPEIAKTTTTAPTITLGASSVSGNPINYTILSGPATVSGNQVTLTKSAGEVRVRATAAATSLLYSSTRDIQFTVVDLSTYLPIVTTRLIEDFPVEVVDTSCFYPIYINAKIEEPSFLSISKVSLNIDGHEVNAIQKNGFYYFGWQPKELKRYNIEITAHGSNGKTTTITRNIEVKDKATAQTVTGFKDAIIQYGTTNSRDFYGTYKFPQHVGVYKQLYAKLEVECPNGNCDDWDRWAYIDIKAPDGNWIQIIRYITPYNVACNHEIDLSDYASLLQGEVEMHIFIDTWGTGGWQLTLDVDYIVGKPTYKYSVVDEVWDGAYDFGNPQNLQPVPDRTLVLHDATAAMKLSLSTTGHGWGANNTGNAAEFYHAKHDIMWAGTRIYEQDLWRKCNPNPDNCTGQQGTWQYDRAGWCPGAISPPDFFDFDNYVESGTATLGYKFQASYKDECHPNNPACQSGVTCADCNAGSNPQYFVDGHLISYSNEGLVYGDPSNLLNTQEHSLGEEEVVLHVFPNPSKGRFKLSVSSFEGSAHLAIFSVDGVQHRRFFVESDRDLENQELNLENLPSGIYFIELVVNTGNRVSQKLVLEK